MMRSRPRVSPIHSPARTSSTKSSALGGAPAARNRLDCRALPGTRGRPSGPSGSPQASAKAGQIGENQARRGEREPHRSGEAQARSTPGRECRGPAKRLGSGERWPGA